MRTTAAPEQSPIADANAAEHPAIGDVMVALEAGDHERASDIARAALDSGLPHPLLLNLRAYWHERNGRLPAALADLEHAHALAPDDASILNALGLCLARLGRNREAVATLDKATALAPEFAAAHFNRAWIGEEMGEFDAARTSYERAQQLGQAVEGNLAALAARRGDWPSARLHAERALAVQPGQPMADNALALAEIAEGQYGSAAERLGRLLGNPTLAPPDRANALGLLADVRDAQGRTGEAFADYEACNAILHDMHAARFANPATENMRQYVERLCRYFAALPEHRWARAGNSQPGNEDGPRRHVFLLGFPRSGTTLLEEVLACHPDVVTTQERDGLAEGVVNLMRDEAALDRLAGLHGAGLVRYRRSYWRRLSDYGVAPRDKIVIDKQPYNTFALPLIAKLFPDAIVLLGIRDPRDVVLSCFRRRFVMNVSSFQLLRLADAAGFYDSVMRLADIYRAKLPLELHAVRHEDLVSDFDSQARAICATVGMNWTEGMKDFANRAAARTIATPSGPQIRQGLNRDGIGYWRRYRTEMQPVLPVLRRWVDRFGYEAD